MRDQQYPQMRGSTAPIIAMITDRRRIFQYNGPTCPASPNRIILVERNRRPRREMDPAPTRAGAQREIETWGDRHGPLVLRPGCARLGTREGWRSEDVSPKLIPKEFLLVSCLGGFVGDISLERMFPAHDGGFFSPRMFYRRSLAREGVVRDDSGLRSVQFCFFGSGGHAAR